MRVPSNRRSKVPRALARAVLVCSAVGCGPSHADLQLMQLSDTVDKLRGRVADYEGRLEKVSHQLLALSQTRVAAARAEEAEPSLPVVQLRPSAQAMAEARDPAEADDGDAAESGDPMVITMDELGRMTLRSASAHATLDGARELLDRALAAYREGNTTGAVAHFEEFVSRYEGHPHVASALFWLGQCHLDLGQYDRAAAHFDRVLTRHGASDKAPEALLKLGVAYERSSRFQEARDAFARLVAAFPSSAVADLARDRLQTLAEARP